MRRRPLLLALASSLLLPAAASAEDVEWVYYQPTYDLHGTYAHPQHTGPVTFTRDVFFHVKGTLPDVAFEGTSLRQNSVKVLRQEKPESGGVETTFSNPEVPASDRCTGHDVKISGMIAVGGAQKGGSSVWFAPWLIASGIGNCVDHEGRTSTSTITADAKFAREPNRLDKPEGASSYRLRESAVGSESFTAKVNSPGPFIWNKYADDEECNGWSDESSDDCTYDISGTVVFTRVRKVKKQEQTPSEVLRPASTPIAPKADPARKHVKAKVRCPYACQIKLWVGTFGMENGKPAVAPDATTTRRGKAGSSTAVSVALSPAMGAGVGLTTMAQLSVTMKGRTRTAFYPLLTSSAADGGLVQPLG